MRITNFMKSIDIDDSKIPNIEKYTNNFDIKLPNFERKLFTNHKLVRKKFLIFTI